MLAPENQHGRLEGVLKSLNSWTPHLALRSTYLTSLAVSAAHGLGAEGGIWIAPEGPFPPIGNKLTLMLDASPVVAELRHIRSLITGAVFRDYYRDMRERFMSQKLIMDVLSPGQSALFRLEDSVVLNAVLEDQILSAFCVHRVNYKQAKTVKLFADLLELWYEGIFPIGLYEIGHQRHLTLIHGSEDPEVASLGLKDLEPA